MTRPLVGLVVGLLLVLTSCGQSGGAWAPGSSPAGRGTTTVFAAASLSEAFPAAAAGAEVSFSFDGSSGLADQIIGGAPADVFASADRRSMDRAATAGLIDGDPVMFATNHLVLVVPRGNPGRVTGFDDSLDSVRLVVCAPEVPCGAGTVRLARSAGLTLQPVSEETNVTDVLGKVTSGEADAGIVYVTDAARARQQIETFDIPGARDEPNTYWIAKVFEAPNPAGADAFLAQITGEQGQAALAGFGFGPSR